jgi:signal transduction histidine kinase
MQYIGDNVSFLKRALDRLLAIATAAEAVAAPDAGDDQRVDLARLLEKSRLAMLRGRGPKAVDDALTGVETVSRIVTAMKRFSHPGSDELELVDVNESLKTTITVCRHEWKYSAELETHLADDLPLIAGSRGLLNQVWLNMIVNSCHAIVERHGDGKGVITITTEGVDDDRGARITIADDGAGIDPANIDRIFDHFFTTKEVGKGTGQGLAFAHRTIVAEHHGTLSVESTLGEGTTFVVTLPVERPPEACPTP